MRFQLISVLATLASMAVADHTVKFVNQGSSAKDIIFTASTGHAAIAKATVAGSGTYTQSFPKSWQGNWYLVASGSSPTPGMLGEVQFDGYNGQHYFDVSAIVNPDDHDGVKELYPASSQTPVSGCQSFPCSNCYNQPDDIATLSSAESDFICLVGTAGAVRRHARQFITSPQA